MSPSQIRSIVSLSALLVLFVAVALSLVSTGNRREKLVFSHGSDFPSTPLPSTLTDEQRLTFQESGILFLPGLLIGDLLEDAIKAGEQVYQTPSLMGLLFRSVYAKLSMQEWRSTAGLARVAFESSMSSIAADLLGETHSIRILKDAVFGQTSTGGGCGFHIDDKGFWPAEDDSTGVNFWVALSDYDVSTGGGIRVAPGSHKAEWAGHCREMIAETPQNTCRMHEISPECDAKINEISAVYDMKPGDAILWDRLIFHRQEPFKYELVGEHKLRYTIRYVPSTARAAVDGILHPSVQRGEPFQSPYHPQVWPEALIDEMKVIHEGLGSDFVLNLPRMAAFLLKKAILPRSKTSP